ncbi:helix-turn-helix domain-containing protein [Streptomyces sp. 7N604]|uniref:helix-turn-helix domain-containing protein n=1 Tax=Streptomyces sp. 7N604 TaxID=3457415 RepID=UPI003FCEE870
MARGLCLSFAAVLDDLCLHPAGRSQRYTNSELAQLVVANGGDITDGYISHLRKGHRDNPTLQTVQDLAAALGVSPAVFVGGRRERLGDEQPRRSFPDKLRRLFHVVHPPGRGPYTPEEVANAISDNGRYGSISSSYLRELLNPPPQLPPNPRLKHLLGLADFFGLADDHGPQVAYFLDDHLAATIDAELDDYAAFRDAGVVEFVTRMAMQAPQWSPQMRRQAIDAFSYAVESGDGAWAFPLRKDGAQ